ncbi:MAG: NAD(P)-dependent oxidoreductase [Planctomycetota bacterium]
MSPSPSDSANTGNSPLSGQAPYANTPYPNTDDARPRDLAGRRVGWVGTGVMGSSMAGHLLDAGAQVVAMNRSPKKLESLVQRGVKAVGTPREVAAASEIVFTIVGYPDDVREVYLDPNKGLFAAPAADRVYVDMTTSSPTLAVELAAAAQQRGEAALDAPVSGGDVGARGGTLSIMVGGEASAFDRVLPCLRHLGETIVLQGGPGSGQHTKMVNQTLIAGGMVAMCEALVYASAAGLDPATVLQSVRGGAAGSWSLNNLAPRILRDDYEPGFYVEHFLKDMKIALDEAERMQISLPGLALAKQLYQSVIAAGGARQGTQALYLALKRLNAKT